MALNGINLGGWLVSERWMTPKLFDGVKGNGERAIGQELPDDDVRRRIEKHRRSFISEKDFKWIAAHGFDFVRLPVGYWAFYYDTGFVPGEEHIKQAFIWARKHNLKIILDFHGLQGSQNGQDHSGQVGDVRLYEGDHRSRALETVDYMTRKYGHEPALLAIELINEPKVGWFIGKLMRYYVRAFRIAQANVAPGVKIIVSDAFKPLRLARALSRKRLGDQLVLDVHLYQLFSKQDQALTLDEHLTKVEEEWRPLLKRLSGYMPILVGEWSAALPKAALESQEEAAAHRRYFRYQRAVFDEVSWGHSYWSYKVPGSGAWSYRDSIKGWQK